MYIPPLFFEQNIQTHFFFYISRLIKLIFKNSKEKNKELKIANYVKEKMGGEETKGQKRGKSMDKNSKNLGYCPICSSNKRNLI